MKIPKGAKAVQELADKFESELDYIPALDRVPPQRKREAAEIAAREALEFLAGASARVVP